MIIRIMGEGQFDVDEQHLDHLNELDDAVEKAVETDDLAAFLPALTALLDGVRQVASEHDPDSLDESDLILPPADASIEEVRHMLADDGLIPG